MIVTARKEADGFRRSVRDEDGNVIRTLQFKAGESIELTDEADIAAIRKDLGKALLECTIGANGKTQVIRSVQAEDEFDETSEPERAVGVALNPPEFAQELQGQFAQLQLDLTEAFKQIHDGHDALITRVADLETQLAELKAALGAVDDDQETDDGPPGSDAENSGAGSGGGRRGRRAAKGQQQPPAGDAGE